MIANFAKDFAEGFDNIRTELLGKGAVLVLLKEEGDTKAFTVLQTIDKGWYPEYTTYYSASTFHVADISSVTAANIRKTAFVAVRNSEMDSQNDILFELKSETAPPDANIPWWRLRAEATSRKFVSPDSEV